MVAENSWRVEAGVRRDLGCLYLLKFPLIWTIFVVLQWWTLGLICWRIDHHNTIVLSPAELWSPRTKSPSIPLNNISFYAVMRHIIALVFDGPGIQCMIALDRFSFLWHPMHQFVLMTGAGYLDLIFRKL